MSSRIYLAMFLLTIVMAGALWQTDEPFVMLSRGLGIYKIPSVWILSLLLLTLPPAMVVRNLGGVLAIVAAGLVSVTTILVSLLEPNQLSIMQLLIGFTVGLMAVVAVMQMDLDLSQFEFNDLLR